MLQVVFIVYPNPKSELGEAAFTIDVKPDPGGVDEDVKLTSWQNGVQVPTSPFLLFETLIFQDYWEFDARFQGPTMCERTLNRQTRGSRKEMLRNYLNYSH